MFKKAVKYEAKGRVALVGPAGSGKSYTMLTMARALVGPKGRIAAIDTEHGSLSKYADLFDFDVMELESFTADAFLDAIDSAADAGYDAFCCDSLSHFWVGKDGALEFVDNAKKFAKDQMDGWKQFRPHERKMVDQMVASKMHVLVTMRTKTEYQEQINDQGKKVRKKIGLAPVQRDGLEYEFDLVAYMDDENNFIVDKTRCPIYSGKAIAKPTAKDFTSFVEWLKGTSRPAPITKEQGEVLVAAAKAKNITSGQLARQAGVTRMGELTVDRLAELEKWIASYVPPTEQKDVDAIAGELVHLCPGLTFDHVADYIEGLPYAKELKSVCAHLAKLRDEKTVVELLAIFKVPVTA